MLQWVIGDIFQALFKEHPDREANLETIVSRFTSALARQDWPDVSDIRSAYLCVVAGLRESSTVRQRHTGLMNAALQRIEDAIRAGQSAGHFLENLDPGKIAQLILLVGLGLIVWDDDSIPLDAQGLGETILELFKKA
ncbi:MAG: hypothetical protein ACYDCC_07750 [Actinomycetota bacterium]